MYEYVEELEQGISTLNTPPAEVLQVGWAADGFPVLYRFGPDKDGNIKEMFPSFQLKSGLRPGDGISAPCGSYSGKYTNDFGYVAGKGDLDECNGIQASITLTTAQGEETFDYYYVVTQGFPQISRCIKGNFNDSFISSSDALSGVDADGDGFVVSYDCDDSNANINPFATDNPSTSFDESCGATLSAQDLDLKDLGYYINSNPNDGHFFVISTSLEEYQIQLFSITGQLVLEQTGIGVLEINTITNAGVYVLRIIREGNKLGTIKIIIK
jgi:hypothetical protein